MEPKKKIKSFDEFKQSNHPRGIFSHEGYEPTQSLRKIMELPMGNVLGFLRVDAENPQVRVETINLPVGMYLEDFPRTMRGRTVPQPIRVRFRDGINVSEIELQNSISDWDDNRSKKDICIQTLDSAGGVIERWDLRGCFPTEVSYHPIGENEEQLYLELTLHYDCCSLHL
jgi:hypothetical protein